MEVKWRKYENFIVKEAIFLDEEKYRFHCWVDVDGEKCLCHLPANCKLGKLIDLKGKRVLITEYRGKSSKFKFTVEALISKNRVILLNLSFLNNIFERELKKKRFSFLTGCNNIFRERTIDDYKADLYIEETKTIIEIKSALSLSNTVLYPQNYSDHILIQLQKLKQLALQNYNVYYFIVALCPSVKTVVIDTNGVYGRLYEECIAAGVKFGAYSLKFNNGKYRVKEQIELQTKSNMNKE